ncbi:extracellular solute-binding protein [Paenibacillus sedimenti]|uniref:Extracellular solute-binding protein n=1 Tax=Paenibacillus sedimenti TaxID=2770274 RepID=A0A926KVG5_9BACL|nr:extracellular solute-binding protein [Paenibacillus sedimenti]MBD0384048.1 extracellular solute-binding protein [Paenibacillus sedimenti]
MRRKIVFIACSLVSFGLLAACSSSMDSKAGDAAKPTTISIVVNQVGENPPKNSEMEKAIEAYTNTDLQIQWIPFSAYDEKTKVMIASGELPKLFRLTYTPTIIATLKAGQFWEIGPYLKNYKHLSAQNKQFYDNIAVGGNIYGVPLYRPLGRASVQYRKDWFDNLGLKLPKTLEDWYEVIKALTLGDPDKNGKNDTYGIFLEKRYNQDVSSTLTRFSVSQGGPNKWKVENGRFTPEFMTEPFYDSMKLFRRLYQEKLINQDFAIADISETSKLYELGRAGIQVVGGNAQSWQDKLAKTVPSAIVDVAPMEGPKGIRLPGEPGNVGFLAVPKDTVKTEEEMKSILAFLDKMLEPDVQTVLNRGIQNRHWVDKGDYAEVLDRELDLKEVKPYRDTLPYMDSNPDLKPIRQPDLYRKNQQIIKENELYIVPNPALTLESETYAERGKELDILITDAQTKFIMGQIDEAGWKIEIEKWLKSGGDSMIREYQEAYAKKE